MDRVYNFAAGPAAMPAEALEIAAKEMLNYNGSGMSVMEMSHRSKAYQEIFDDTEATLRALMHIPQEYAVLFLQGGATGQFAAIPMNLLSEGGSADYVDSGNFAHGAMVEAQKYGDIRCVASSKDENYIRIPALDPSAFNPNADYFYITTNNTIFGTRYPELPQTGSVPLVADMSSNILSEVFDISRFGVAYAGAQKNVGPAGLTIVIVRRDLLGKARANCPKIFNWKVQDEKGSMLNTPPTYAIYMAGLCMKWLQRQGGVEGIEKVNIEKAKLLYDVLDDSDFYRAPVLPEYRSRMNVTFTTPTPEQDAAFVKAAAAQGLVSLKGHRLVGGIRASIYNAMPVEGVKKLAAFMKQFETENR